MTREGIHPVSCKITNLHYILQQVSHIEYLACDITYETVRVTDSELGTCLTQDQRFSTFVRPRPGKFFFHKTRARSQQIYS